MRDLNLPLEFASCRPCATRTASPCRRATQRLSPDERVRARAIPRALEAGLSRIQAGRDPVAAARAELGPIEIDYVAVASFGGRPTLVLAARVGRTRLIDNVPLEETDGKARGQEGKWARRKRTMTNSSVCPSRMRSPRSSR